MNFELIEALKQIEREKEISFETLLDGLESALASAYKRDYREVENVRVNVNETTGEITVYEQVPDEEGEGFTEHEVTPEDFGRIAAQTAKQVILQKIREAGREKMYDEYVGRVGDIITGIIQQSDHRYTLIDLGRVEALLPPQEQVPTERYEHGMRLKTYIMEVRRTSKGPQIIVSRTHSGLLRRLFELEVPEICDGYVEIKSAVREPGYRSKIAVASKDRGIDPVGACVGPKGSRVRMVVNELRGEKIDIIQWNEDPALFVANALSPANVKEVIVEEEEKSAEVVVPDSQLSLAIGKEGQNARLAAKLTGWRIDIKNESQAREEEQMGEIPVYLEEVEEEASPKQCKAITSSGKRCPNQAKEGSDYCGIPAHQRKAQADAEEQE